MISRTIRQLAHLVRELEKATRPPRLGHDTDEPVDGAEQLTEHEAEQEVSEPLLPGTVTRRWNSPAYGVHLGYRDCPQCGAICDENGDCRWCPMPNWQRGRMVAHGVKPTNFAGAAASLADVSEFPHGVSSLGNSSVREDKQHVSAAPHTASAGVQQAASVEHPAGGEPPETPPAGPTVDGLQFRFWVEPAIWTALEPHEPRLLPGAIVGSTERVLCCRIVFYDWQEWREHVSGPIADRIETALLATDFGK